ncbi:Sporulation-specific protein 1 [Nakaseomyces bracarensis]|uniref:Sporulation-specific protein 1 n=1 Tax=Nakaseomyces bracarensis TaxID=273131 RepID=A0ABR4NRR3_9SACH
MFGMNVYTAPESIGVLNHPVQSVEPPVDNIYAIEQMRQGGGKRSYLLEKLKQLWGSNEQDKPKVTNNDTWFGIQGGLFSRLKLGERKLKNPMELSEEPSYHLQDPTPSIRVNIFGEDEIGEDTLTRFFNKSHTSVSAEKSINPKNRPKMIEAITEIPNTAISEPIAVRNIEVSNNTDCHEEPYPKQFDPNTVDLSHLTTIQDPIYRKKVNLQLIKRRITTIASKRNDLLKAERKLLRDLKTWEKNPYLSETVTPGLVEDVCTMFTQDLEFEQRLAQALKLLADTLGIVSKRESDLITAKKDLNNALLKYNKVKEKKTENEEEIQLLKEKVITFQQSLEVIQFHYDQSVAIYARKQFNNYSIELYETCSDLRDHAERFIKNSFGELERTNADCFTEDLENLRRRRAQQYWSTLAPEERRNPIKWENLKSGVYEQEDPLLKAIYKSLPTTYSANVIQGNPFKIETILKNYGSIEDSYLDRSSNVMEDNIEGKIEDIEKPDERTIIGINNVRENNDPSTIDETLKGKQKCELVEVKLNTESWRKDEHSTKYKNVTAKSPILKERFDSAKETLEENAWSTNSGMVGNNENKSHIENDLT